MSLSEVSETDYSGKDRRSSIRARTMLSIGVEVVAPESIEQLESLIVDTAVLDAEHATLSSDWAERSEELPREMVYILSEIRALRQQLTDILRNTQMSGAPTTSLRWIVINDRGLWLPEMLEDNRDLKEGDFVRVELQIPSLASPRILALGEVIRVREGGSKPGTAIEFRSISAIHAKAIIRYALRRERQLARAKLYSSVNL